MGKAPRIKSARFTVRMTTSPSFLVVVSWDVSGFVTYFLDPREDNRAVQIVPVVANHEILLLRI